MLRHAPDQASPSDASIFPKAPRRNGNKRSAESDRGTFKSLEEAAGRSPRTSDSAAPGYFKKKDVTSPEAGAGRIVDAGALR